MMFEVGQSLFKVFMVLLVMLCSRWLEIGMGLFLGLFVCCILM